MRLRKVTLHVGLPDGTKLEKTVALSAGRGRPAAPAGRGRRQILR